MAPYLTEQRAYGVEWDGGVSSPLCARIGNPALHASLPIQSRMRRCLLRDDGTVNYYLHPNDSTLRDTGAPANLTGADGMVMVEIPEHWRRFEHVGAKWRVLLSEFELPGFHRVPRAYRSAYEAALQRSTLKLCSVVNTTADFRGGKGADDAAFDALGNSLLGRPATFINLPTFRAYARNRGAYGKSGAGWNCDVYDLQKACYWLYVVEYANRHCQAAYNAQPDASGYMQGGLGEGVTTLNSTLLNNWNGQRPFIPCGYTNPLGNRTGTRAYDLLAAGYGAELTVQVPSYRGIENPFGHTWTWTDGCKLLVKSDDSGGKSEFYVCSDPAKFGDSGSDFTGYEKRGEMSRVVGFIKELLMGEFGDNVPRVAAESGTSATTYFADYNYTTNIPSSGESLRGLPFGAASSYGAVSGLACVRSDYAPSSATAHVGSRLCFIPA